MKKSLFLICLIVIITANTSAEDVVWGSMYEPFNLRLEADAAFEVSSSGNQLALYPQVEMLLWKPLTEGVAFIDIGGTVKGRFGLPLTFGNSLTAGIGVLGTIHAGFRGFDFTGAEYLSKIDLFAELGLGVDIVPFGIGFTAKSGINYFITESLAVGAFYSNWIEHSGGGISITLKLGDTPDVENIEFEMPETRSGFAVEPYLLQFYTLYYSAHYAGGFYPDNFKEGQGSVHRISTISDSVSEYVVKKALLKNYKEKKLWSLEYKDEGDVFYYEYATDTDNSIVAIYFDDGEQLHVMDAKKAKTPENEYLTWEDYQAESRDGVEIYVEAGKFTTTEYVYVDETGVEVNWWLSEDVPGNLVSYKMEDGEGIVTSELIDITSRNLPILKKQ